MLEVSRRGGELWCELAGDRVKLAGHCAFFMQGKISLPEAKEAAGAPPLPAFAK